LKKRLGKKPASGTGIGRLGRRPLTSPSREGAHEKRKTEEKPKNKRGVTGGEAGGENKRCPFEPPEKTEEDVQVEREKWENWGNEKKRGGWEKEANRGKDLDLHRIGTPDRQGKK